MDKLFRAVGPDKLVKGVEFPRPDCGVAFYRYGHAREDAARLSRINGGHYRVMKTAQVPMSDGKLQWRWVNAD